MVACTMLLTGAATGCTAFGNIFDIISLLTGSNAPTPVTLGIAVVLPITPTTTTPGAPATVQWADIATEPGTVVRVEARRQDDNDEDVGDPIHLIGDGTAGTGRDALSDGSADEFEWELDGVLIGEYEIVVTIESPSGETLTVSSRDADRGTTGVFNVITALPIPTLTFTQPAANTTLMTGDTFNITWTDNGDANEVAVVRLALDPDDDHDSGNEITLVRDQLLSTDSTTGQFTFAFVDENGNTVPDGTYSVFSVVTDGANLPVTSESAGDLVLNP